MNSDAIYPVAIIGAGPAGISAAVQLKRCGVSPLLLECNKLGGLLNNANLVENYPGFPGGIRGCDLAELFAKQAETTGVQVISAQCTDLVYIDNLFHLKVQDNVYRSRILVIASGTKPRRFTDFEIPVSVQDRVHYEVYPLRQLENKRIIIIGAGDAAFDYAINLSRNNHVFILNRNDHTRCLPLLQERAKMIANIQYRENLRVSHIELAGERMIIKCVPTSRHASESEISFPADYLIGAIGREPRLDFASSKFMNLIQSLDKQGILHIIGDVCRGHFRQTAIAVGDGLLAAMKINNRLKESNW